MEPITGIREDYRTPETHLSKWRGPAAARLGGQGSLALARPQAGCWCWCQHQENYYPRVPRPGRHLLHAHTDGLPRHIIQRREPALAELLLAATLVKVDDVVGCRDILGFRFGARALHSFGGHACIWLRGSCRLESPLPSRAGAYPTNAHRTRPLVSFGVSIRFPQGIAMLHGGSLKACENRVFWGRNSGPLSSCRSPQGSYRSDRVTRDGPMPC